MDDGLRVLAEHGAKAPNRRAADPAEIAEIVPFLASDRASFIVGSVVMAMAALALRSADREWLSHVSGGRRSDKE